MQQSGVANRTLITPTSSAWPNATIKPFSNSLDYNVQVGSPTNFTYFFQDADSDLTVAFALDNDTNPFNDSANSSYKSIGTSGVLAMRSAISAPTIFQWTPTAADVGAHYVQIKATDTAGHVRYDYLLKPVNVMPSAQAKSDLVIENMSVTPNSGEPGSGAALGFTIRNKGTGVAYASAANIRFNASSSVVTSSDTPLALGLSVPQLEAGSSYQVQRNISIPATGLSGAYYVWAIADIHNAANQSDTSAASDMARVLYSVSVPPSASAVGDFVQVYGTGVSGLRVRSPNYSDNPLSGLNRFDGAQGVVLGGPQTLVLNGVSYTMWKIEWSDGVIGWSAQNWLKKIPYANIPGNVAPTISTSSSLPSGTINSPYSAALQASGGCMPYNWTKVSGSLPTGLGLIQSLGSITGTPTVATAASFRARVTGANNLYAEANFSLTINSSPDTIAPTVAINSPANGQSVNTAAILVSGVASDPGTPSTGLAVVEVRVNGGAWQSASGTANWSASLALLLGSNAIQARSRDNAGNYSATSTVSVVSSATSATEPAVSAVAATGISNYSARIWGQIVSDGGLPVAQRGMEWGPVGNFIQSTTNVVVNGNYYYFDLTGLSPNATYQFRVWAGNQAGTGFSAPLTFTTSASGGSTAVTNVIFQDNFNDNTIASGSWTNIRNVVQESGQMMQVLTTVTDAGGNLTSSPFPISRTGLITITRKVKVHYANNYYVGRFQVRAGSLGQFGVYYANMDYNAPEYDTSACHGFYLGRNDANPHTGTNRLTDTSSAMSPVWDTWFDEKMIYDPVSGQLSYFINGAHQLDYNVGALPADGPATLSLNINAWGWWTGHEQLFDDLLITQPGSTNSSSNVGITVLANPLAGGNVSGTGTFAVGAIIQISATASNNWLFSGWNDGNINATRLVAVPSTNIAFTANFVPAATISLQVSSPTGGRILGSGIYAAGSSIPIGAQPTMGWRFVNWSDGDTNRFRSIILGSSGTNLTANFQEAPTSVLLQAGDGGMAGIWGLGTNYLPATWTATTGALGGGWVLRSMNQNRILLQQGTGGAISIWDLTNGVPSRTWSVSGVLPGWIARDLDDNRVLLQAGDGGMVGIWTLNASNTPAAWSSVSGPVAGLVARTLRGDRLLLQFGSSTTMGYWTLNASNAITAWTPITSTQPAGWIPRAMTRDYVLLQAGDGGASGIWDLDANGLPTAFHTLAAAMSGWIMRGIDQALPAVITVGSSTNIGGSVTGGGTNFAGASVVLTATASNGWIFTSWNDGNTNSTRSVVVPAGGGTYTASFVRAVNLNVVVSPANGGRASGSGTYAAGASALISATASNGWVFTGWNDSVTNNPRTVTVPPGGATYTANFVTGIILGLQCSPTNSGNMTGAGTYLAGAQVSIAALPLTGWKFFNWNDGDTNQTRLFTLGAANTNLLANFTNSGALKILLQAGNGGMAGLWGLATNYSPATWAPVTGALGGGWVLRAVDQNRILLQAGTGGAINIWDLTNGVPSKTWNVIGALSGWIARDLDGNRILLQAGDGGMVGLWTLSVSNTPAAWNALASSVTPGLVARALCGNKVLVQVGTAGSYWTLTSSNTVGSTTAIAAALPAGWILRSMTPSYMLLQAGDGGLTGIWVLDANGQPTAWYTVSGAMAGWIMRGLDQ